jgi:hypothetical protein
MRMINGRRLGVSGTVLGIGLIAGAGLWAT